MSFTRPSLLFLSMRWMTSSSSFLPSRLRMVLPVSGPGPDKDIDKRGGFWYSTRVPCANDTRWCGAMAAQLICNQWVAGSTPVTSSKKVLRYTAEKRRVSWGFCFYVSDCIAAIQKNHAARRGAGVEIGSSRRRCGVWRCSPLRRFRAKAGLRLPASAALPLASCWPLPQQLLPVSAAGGGRRRCS